MKNSGSDGESTDSSGDRVPFFATAAAILAKEVNVLEGGIVRRGGGGKCGSGGDSEGGDGASGKGTGRDAGRACRACREGGSAK